MKQWLRNNLLPALIAALIRLIGLTVRIRLADPHEVAEWRRGRNFILAYWHNRILLLACAYRKFLPHQPMLTLSSLSNDGQLMVDVLSLFGIGAVRGSTSRHGRQAFLQSVTELKDHRRCIGITPDGPRGPRYKAQMGILALSKATGVPIVPLQWHSERKWVIARSWDRFQIPVPFTRAECRLGEPISVPGDAGPEVMEEYRQRLEKALGGD
jgi:lysophospholipid acyltransferase (LPLAT)-like uncharacterized protein